MYKIWVVKAALIPDANTKRERMKEGKEQETNLRWEEKQVRETDESRHDGETETEEIDI